MPSTETVSYPGMTHTNGVTEYRGSRYEWYCTDAGRSDSKRPKQRNDCTVRALTLVAEIPYDEAYDYLAKRGRKCSRGTFFPKRRGDDSAFGLAFIWQSFPAEKGKRRMNIGDFCEAHPTGTYIARTAKHVFAVIDGVVYDAHRQAPYRCVYGCWKVLTERGS